MSNYFCICPPSCLSVGQCADGMLYLYLFIVFLSKVTTGMDGQKKKIGTKIMNTFFLIKRKFYEQDHFKKKSSTGKN